MDVKPARRKIVGSIQTTRPSSSTLHPSVSTPPPVSADASRPGYSSAPPSSTRSAPSSTVGVGPSKVRALNGQSSSTAKARVKVQPSSLASSPGVSTYSNGGGGEPSWNGGSSVGARATRAPSPAPPSAVGSTTARARPVSARSYSPAPVASSSTSSAVGGSSRPLVNRHARTNSGGSAVSFASAPPSAHHSNYNSHLSASTSSSPRPRAVVPAAPPVPPLPRSISTGFNSLPRSGTTTSATSTPRAQLLPSLFPPSTPATQASSPPSYFNSTPPSSQPHHTYSPPPLLSPPDSSPITNGRDSKHRRASTSSSLSSDSPESKSNLSFDPHRDGIESSPSAKSTSSHPLSPTFSSLPAVHLGPPLSSSASYPFPSDRNHHQPISSPPPVSFFNAHALPSVPSNGAFSSPSPPTATYHQQPMLRSRGSISSSVMGVQADMNAEETPEMVEKRKEKEEMKVNRKIADLEISNTSLLAVNRMLEATKAKQAKEIRDLRRRLRTGSVHPVASSARPFPSRRLSKIDMDGNEVSDSGEESDESEEDEQFIRLRGTMQSLLDQAQKAVSAPISTFSNREGIGSPGGAYGGARVLGILEVEKYQNEGEDVDSQDGGGDGDLSFVSEGVEGAEDDSHSEATGSRREASGATEGSVE